MKDKLRKAAIVAGLAAAAAFLQALGLPAEIVHLFNF